jgi:hypothetical protein
VVTIKANYQDDPIPYRDQIFSDTLITSDQTSNRTPNWTANTTTILRAKTYESCVRCYNRVAMYAQRTHHVNAGVHSKRKTKGDQRVFNMGELKKKVLQKPGG